eukprot:2848213-Amphidinium_carterae.1
MFQLFPVFQKSEGRILVEDFPNIWFFLQLDLCWRTCQHYRTLDACIGHAFCSRDGKSPRDTFTDWLETGWQQPCLSKVACAGAEDNAFQQSRKSG